MTHKEKYCGVIVPMTTPLTQQGEIDQQGVINIVNGLISNRCIPFVLGTTGESLSIGEKQKLDLVRYTVEATAGKDLVYAGISGNCYQESVAQAHAFSDFGADVLVAHLPCYYPIDEAQMEAYYLALADASPLPLMLYNIPVTTNLSMPMDLIDRLSRHENIVGFKDSERGEDRLQQGLELWRDRQDFTYHLGWAAKSSAGLQGGLDGIVPASANLTPGLYRGIYDAVKNGDFDEADRLQAITDEVSAYYQEGRTLSHFIPILKAMLAAADLCEPYVAPPMITLPQQEIEQIKNDVLTRFGQYLS